MPQKSDIDRSRLERRLVKFELGIDNHSDVRKENLALTRNTRKSIENREFQNESSRVLYY